MPALCTGWSIGPLHRAAIRCGRLFVTGKDRVGFKSDDPREAITGSDPEAPPEMWPADGAGGPEDLDWPVVRDAIAVIGVGHLGRRMKVSDSKVRHWLTGDRMPADPQAVKNAVIGAIKDSSHFLFGAFAGESDTDLAARLPARAFVVRQFLGEVARRIARDADLSNAARATGLPRNTLREWCGVPVPERPLGRVAIVAAGLGKWARAEIKAVGRSISFEPGIAGDLQAICAALALRRGEKAEPPDLSRLYAVIEEEGARLAFDRLPGFAAMPRSANAGVIVLVEHEAWGLGAPDPPERYDEWDGPPDPQPA
jgi:hypothetical protein